MGFQVQNYNFGVGKSNLIYYFSFYEYIEGVLLIKGKFIVQSLLVLVLQGECFKENENGFEYSRENEKQLNVDE